MDTVTGLEQAYTQLGTLISGMSKEQLDARTVCDQWDVRSLLNHTFGAAWMFTLVNEGKSVGEDAGDIVGDNPEAALAEVAPANLASWKAPGAMEGDRAFPFGTFPAPAAALINLGEVVVHAWDLARATGQDATIDPDLAEVVYDFYRQVPLDQYRAHGAFGPEVKVADSASAGDKMLGLLGRQP